MPTTFTTVSSGDVIQASHINQFAAPINNLEKGVAYLASVTSSGTDAYAVTQTPAPSSYTSGMVVNFVANFANSAAATLNVNSLGAKDLKKEVSADLETGDILNGQMVAAIYDGTAFQMISPSAGALSSSTQGSVSYLKRPASGSSSILTLWNNQATGAANDAANLRFSTSDSAGTTTEAIIANIQAIMPSATAGSFTGSLVLATASAGTSTGRLRIETNSHIGMNLPVGVNLAGLTTAPAAQMEVLHASSAQLRLTNTAATHWCDFTVNSSGRLTISSVLNNGGGGTGEISLSTNKLGFYGTAPTTKQAGPTTVAAAGASYSQSHVNDIVNQLNTVRSVLLTLGLTS